MRSGMIWGRACSLDLVADKPELLKVAPENLATFRNMVDEAVLAFGAEALRPLRLPAGADRSDGRHRAGASPFEREPIRAAHFD